MGGLGSGRRRSYAGRLETDDFSSLDIRLLSREKLLVPGIRYSGQWSEGDRVATLELRVQCDSFVLIFKPFSSDTTVEHWLDIETTPCQFGGRRPWFKCPRCDRRVAVLYEFSRHFACRHCGGLAYSSQKEGVGTRAVHQADAIRKRLGWRAGVAYGTGLKPKGMHWKTFDRLKVRYEKLTYCFYQETARKLGLVERLLDKISVSQKRIRGD